MKKHFSLTLLIFWSIIVAANETESSQWHGSWQQGGMVYGYIEKNHRLTMDNREIPVADDGFFVLGFARDEAEKVDFAIYHGDQLVNSFSKTLLKQNYRIQRVNGVPQQTVTPSEEHLARIRNEAELVKKARQAEFPDRFFTQTFIWPTKGPITGVFGSQRVYNGVPGNPHYGVDVGMPTGTPVVSPADGVVTLAEPDLFYSGGTVIVDHGMGVSSTVMHMSKVHTSVGQQVKQGDLLGEVGATGRATGPHLDWRMNWRTTRIDPALIVGPMPKENID